ncbi:CwfJ C-terminus 1-domain-containing protein-like protein [Phyllosticta citribraziliensis]|uniref:CwfJ C-terminus 1-domain-containing protein-like protein n=1 Tax=Phyllosticta citribraziliensis TaxID=989973 RepID=A0ABR1LD71_9PEZI
MASKIVVVGGVNGQFPDVFKKIAGLHAKNSFAFAIVAGDLFSDPQSLTEEDEKNIEDLISGKTEVTLPTYFTLGSKALPNKVAEKLDASAGELCPNLYFLGKRSTLKTSEGIRIVALGGRLDQNLDKATSDDKYTPSYSEQDARVLRGASTADILITAQWPAEIRTGSKVESQPDGEQLEQACISDLASNLKPRYHFSTSGNIFYEREPFFHVPTEDAPDGYKITRFISLANYGNANKQKWIYAFSLDPNAAPPISIPPGTTASPLSFASKKRSLPNQETSYRFSTNDEGGSHRRKGNKRQRTKPLAQGECFFCLSNANIATHLITSIGDDAYLTTAKGPLSTASTFSPHLKFPSHMLIIPLNHTPTLASIGEPESRKSAYDEMQRYRRALQTMVSRLSSGKLGAVTWEVSRASGIHTHWQFLPVPVDLIARGLVDAAFKVQAQNEQYPKFEKKDVGDGFEEGNDFFRLLIWSPPGEGEDEGSEGKETSLILPLDPSFRFDLQFGRRVLAKLLGLESRVDWRDCGQSHEDEVGDAEAFKAAFKPFDFSLEE